MKHLTTITLISSDENRKSMSLEHLAKKKYCTEGGFPVCNSINKILVVQIGGIDGEKLLIKVEHSHFTFSSSFIFGFNEQYYKMFSFYVLSDKACMV